jgi:hypothetical protein
LLCSLEELPLLHKRLTDCKISVTAEVRVTSRTYSCGPAITSLWMISDDDLERAAISLDDQITDYRSRGLSALCVAAGAKLTPPNADLL